MPESSRESTLKIQNPSWWRRRPRTEKVLLAIVTTLIFLIIIMLSVNLSRCKYGSHDICFTPDCVKTATQVLEKVDLNVNPCEDFYKFACGNFIKNTVIPEDKTSITSFTIVEDEVEELMHNLLKKPIVSTDIKPFVLAKTLYRACMNTTEIEANSLQKFKRLIKSTGGWPVVEGDGWDENSFDWVSTSYQLMKVGLTPYMLLNFKVLPDSSNSSRKALVLDQVKIELDKIKRNGFNETIFQAYYEYMKKVVVVLGAEETKASEEMRAVAELVVTLARITLPEEELRDATSKHNPMSVSKLETTFGYVPWLNYINTMMHPYKKFNSDDIVIVKVPSYYEKLESVLKNTSKRTLANYMYWSLAEDHITYLNDELRNLELDFNKPISGIDKRPLRWKECTQACIRLYVASGALFVRNFFKKEAKAAVVEMTEYIKDAFIQTLKSVDWMDADTKKQALDKAKAIHLHTAYPDELLDDQKLELYYKNLTFDASDYLGSMLNLSLFKSDVEYPQLDEKLDKKDWRNHGYVALVQAFYDSSENSIEFLAGILRNVFFDDRKPKYMNYGAIGHIIGHEITHGFDDEGRQFDKDGNLVNWWQQKTKEAFDAKAQCIIDQYGNITVPEVNLNLNGINTQGENIADNAGIKLAYLAYKAWSKKHGPEQVLPGLPYTPEQMFWIAVANIWCKVEATQWLQLVVVYDKHAPHQHRVNVPLMNSEYFIKDFKCNENSKMNPKHKCHVW
ncbi:hypothetical protein Zmor_013632 [Zophobas morio]|uniref:Uncharacterized protein n=1 Tax=Zophobas morio TaxID=2755281 RepID=A0AA38MFK7_9CUCU|nr:hypothetical protein Zmor_013632 [Zophobas morio]